MFENENDISQGKRQFKKHARIAAEADPRNAYSMVAMTTAFAKDLSPHLIMNWDVNSIHCGVKP